MLFQLTAKQQQWNNTAEVVCWPNEVRYPLTYTGKQADRDREAAQTPWNLA